MKHLDYLLRNLQNDYCEPLYEYNQYLLKRFFEHALENENYTNKVLSGSTGLRKIGYCPRHEKILITACICASQNNRRDIYKHFYNEYVEFKGRCSWRGRGDWFDFHRTVLSHFIWTEDMDSFYWTWARKGEYLQDLKDKNKKISDWRRKWYLAEVDKLRIYLLRVCAVRENIDMVTDLISNNIIKLTKDVRMTLLKFGYEYKDNNIVSADFTETDEWKWLHDNSNTSVDDIDVDACIDICMKSNFNKSRIIDLFNAKEPVIFWNTFINMNKENINFITCKNISRMLSSGKYNTNDEALKKKIIKRVFDMQKHITNTLVSSISICLGDYKLSVNDGIDILLDVFKTEQTDSYSYLSHKCEYFIGNKTINDSTEKYDTMTTDNLYWLCTLLGTCIQSVINTAIDTKDKKLNIKDPCPICLCPMKNSNACRLPCGHYFHRKCVEQDYNCRNCNNSPQSSMLYNCPMCRSKVHFASLKYFNIKNAEK